MSKNILTYKEIETLKGIKDKEYIISFFNNPFMSFTSDMMYNDNEFGKIIRLKNPDRDKPDYYIPLNEELKLIAIHNVWRYSPNGYEYSTDKYTYINPFYNGYPISVFSGYIGMRMKINEPNKKIKDVNSFKNKIKEMFFILIGTKQFEAVWNDDNRLKLEDLESDKKFLVNVPAKTNKLNEATSVNINIRGYNYMLDISFVDKF